MNRRDFLQAALLWSSTVGIPLTVIEDAVSKITDEQLISFVEFRPIYLGIEQYSTHFEKYATVLINDAINRVIADIANTTYNSPLN